MLADTSLLIDLIVLAVVVLAAIGGWRRGGSAVVIHVVGLIVGLVIGLRLAHLLSSSLSPAAHVLLGVGCAVGGLVVGGAIGRRLGARVAHGITRVHLGLLDRVLGALARGFGAAVAIWLVLAVVVAVGPSAWAAPVRHARLAAGPDGLPVVGPVARGLTSALVGSSPGDVAALVPDLDPSSVPAATISRIDARVSGSVFEIGADGCSGPVVGTAFVVARVAGGELVVTNNHVVRGAQTATLDTGAGGMTAVPLVLDRRADLAVLRVSGLSAPVLSLSSATAPNGTRAVIVGYPHGGPRTAVGATVVQRLPVPDPGLSDGLALHMAYRIAADVEHGDSGSPLLDRDGRVLGVVNATAGGGTDEGYAITDSELRPDLRAALSTSDDAAVGRCT